MVEDLGVKGLGDFLEWPPARYLTEGFYDDPAKTAFRRDLLGMYAIKSAFRFRYEGVRSPEARAYMAELEKAAGTSGQALPAALEALGKRLLEPPFAQRLFYYDFFSECVPFIKDDKDLAALAKHVGYVVDRLALVEALAEADPEAMEGQPQPG